MTTLQPFLAYPLHVQQWVRPSGSRDYRVTNPYGGIDLVNPGQSHRGTDIGNFRQGDPIRAPVSCRAKGYTHTDGAIGAILDLGGGWQMELWHLSRHVLSLAFQSVGRGQLLGYTGASGNVSGAHTHIELKHNGVNVDPAPHLPMAEREALSIPGATAGDRYSDVTSGDPFYADIELVSQLGIMIGTGDGRFRPGERVTRGQLAAVAARLYRKLNG